MIRSDPQARRLATVLALLAGYVDAVGFLASRGFFVSFMSGNSTRLGVESLAMGDLAGLALTLIGGFVSGVLLGTLTGRKLVIAGRPQGAMPVVALLLVTAAATGGHAPISTTLAIMAVAMGAANVVLRADGGGRIGVTYMTGALVRIGEGLAAALVGEGRWHWMPWAMLWIALVAGATGGALAFRLMGLGALWLAATLATVLAVLIRHER